MTAQPPPDHRAAAHQYLERGFMPVGWVVIGDRKAAVSMKGRHYEELSVTHAEIDKWSWRWQTGLAMCQRSGFWALDFDCGPERAEQFDDENVVRRTAVNLTARGAHLVYRGAGESVEWPRDGVWSADWLDVQVRSAGFIAVAPSVHPSGVPYRWLDEMMPVEPSQMLLIYRPERAPRRGGGSGSRDGGPDGDLAFYEQHGIPVGWQDDEIHRLACAHVRTMGHRELCARLWAAASASAQRRTDPWRPEDIEAKVRRAAEWTGREDKAVRAVMADWKAARP